MKYTYIHTYCTDNSSRLATLCSSRVKLSKLALFKVYKTDNMT